MEFSVLFMLLYFVPTIIVMIRKTHNIGPVIVINLFLGWTFIGWIVALAMSVSNNRNIKQSTYINKSNPISDLPPPSK
ncbi:superinfection immunity protein [Flavobacterium sp.]|uniref:superinfection immunity protein n=1 Tax=Flavobacterium sp. TaxID=239 RepID=UPI003BE5248C